MTSTKPYDIAKRTIWDAYQRVRANRGAAGIDDGKFQPSCRLNVAFMRPF